MYDDIVHRLCLQVIDNDKLTVANLNRIKTLEAQLNESARLVEALETENVELRRAIADENEVRHRAECERQLGLRRVALLQVHNDGGHRLSGKKRSGSLLDRFGIGTKLQALHATLAAQ